MRYVGGKHRIAKWVSEHFLAHAKGKTVYLEPFVGSGANFLEHSPHFETVIAADAHPDLILMWQALANGWTPPASITRDEYDRLKGEHPSPLRGLVGFGASFSGKWFGGYVDKHSVATPTPLFEAARRSALKTAPFFRPANVWHCDYSEHEIDGSEAIYCDPPYAGTLTYAGTKFDSASFWRRAQAWAEAGAIVMVSEESAPQGWAEVASRDRKAMLRIASNEPNETRTEKLYVWKGLPQ